MNHNPHKEKATEIVDWFWPRMYCYLGSGMLTNDPDESVTMANAKQCATKYVEGKLSTLEGVANNPPIESGVTGNWTDVETEIENWQQVKLQIEKL